MLKKPPKPPSGQMPTLGPCIQCFYHSINNGVMHAYPLKVCTLYPPAVIGTLANTSAFPVVDDNWTCGSFLQVKETS